MRPDSVTIPAALQIVVDDVGWMIGYDRRWEDEPSRTGMPRRHVLADYQMLGDLGQALDMKILCPFVIGEWDRGNRLRRLPDASKMGAKWDSAPYLRADEAAIFRDYLESCAYIELGLHGLLHDRWHHGKLIGPREFYIPEGYVKGAPEKLAPEPVIRAHLDTYFDIYADWGFHQGIRSFASPGSSYGDSWKTDDLARIIAGYGIRYWCNTGFDACLVRSGIIINPKDITLAPWEAYDLDPESLPDFEPDQAGIVGAHWPNFLRFNPEKNDANLEAWTAFFKRQGERFGMILAKDFAFASHQQRIKRTARTCFRDHQFIINLSAVDQQRASGDDHPVYVSIRHGLVPAACSGGRIETYQVHRDFCHYAIHRTGDPFIAITLEPGDDRAWFPVAG